MKALLSFKIQLTIYRLTRCNISEDLNLHYHRCKNLKSHTKHVGYIINGLAKNYDGEYKIIVYAKGALKATAPAALRVCLPEI